jgi:hypothetical protein
MNLRSGAVASGSFGRRETRRTPPMVTTIATQDHDPTHQHSLASCLLGDLGGPSVAATAKVEENVGCKKEEAGQRQTRAVDSTGVGPLLQNSGVKLARIAAAAIDARDPTRFGGPCAAAPTDTSRDRSPKILVYPGQHCMPRHSRRNAQTTKPANSRTKVRAIDAACAAEVKRTPRAISKREGTHHNMANTSPSAQAPLERDVRRQRKSGASSSAPDPKGSAAMSQMPRSRVTLKSGTTNRPEKTVTATAVQTDPVRRFPASPRGVKATQV